MRLPPGQLTALLNLADKEAGKAVDWISIAHARALADQGLAERTQAGWRITDAGLAALDNNRTRDNQHPAETADNEP
jgi:hypothetical protein